MDTSTANCFWTVFFLAVVGMGPFILLVLNYRPKLFKPKPDAEPGASKEALFETEMYMIKTGSGVELSPGDSRLSLKQRLFYEMAVLLGACCISFGMIKLFLMLVKIGWLL